MELTFEELVEKNKKLEERLAYYENIIASLPGHVYWLDKEGIYLGCNDNQAKSAGLSHHEEIIGKRNKDLPWNIEENLPKQLDQINAEVIKTGKTIILEESACVLPDGTIPFFLSIKSPFFNGEKEIIGVIGISIDITERRKQEIEEYLENIISLLPGHVYWKNREGIFLGCNEAQAKSAGFLSSEEMLGKTDLDMPWKDQAEILRKYDLEVMNTGISRTVEEPSILADGTEAVFLSKKVPFYYKNEIVGVLGISFDITEQRKTEKKLLETEHKLDGMTLVSASTAHELRTPLASLNIGVSTLKKILPQLMESYKLAKEAHFSLPSIKPEVLNLLEHKLESMQKEIYASQTFINMLLMNLNPDLTDAKIEAFSIFECIKDAISRYPFVGDQQKLVEWQETKSTDFFVKGEVLFVEHIIFNLLKNAIYYVLKAGKGNIHIWTEKNSSGHKLYFKDTGAGIPSEMMPHIFDRFFSKTRHGAGIGLTFCKMVMEGIGGSIVCESQEGVYTLFILTFPS